MPKKTLIITAIMVAVIALGATAVYIVQRQEAGKVGPGGVATIPKETPEESIVQSPDTSRWMTYRMKECGFEIKYPLEAKLWDSGCPYGRGIIIRLAWEVTPKGVRDRGIWICCHDDPEWTPPVGTDVIEWLRIQAATDPLSEFSPYVNYLPEQCNATIDGVKAVRLKDLPNGLPEGEEIFVIHNRQLFQISVSPVYTKEEEELYERILSTFHFLEGR
jgi:hypothetical protein